jgi:C4-dicarboxylate-binding protein DctP
MLAPSLAKFGPLGVKEFEVFDLPYIIPDKAALARVTKGKVAKELFAKLAPKGIEGLAYWDNGFKIMTANKPLHHVADFHGLKMRIQSSKVLEAEMRALGAVPQAMAFSEVYQAMSTGVVDGAENPPSNVFTQKMHEVQKHGTISNHGYVGYAVIVNKKFWDALPEDIRTQLQKAMDEATDYANGIAQEENDDAIAAMKKAGTTTFYELTADEKAEWMKAMQPVADEVASRIGKDLIAEFRKEAGGGS